MSAQRTPRQLTGNARVEHGAGQQDGGTGESRPGGSLVPAVLLFLLLDGLLPAVQSSNCRQRVQSRTDVLTGQRARERRHVVDHARALLPNRLQERRVPRPRREAVFGRDLDWALLVVLLELAALLVRRRRRWRLLVEVLGRRRLVQVLRRWLLVVELLSREGVRRRRCGMWRDRVGRGLAAARRRRGASIRCAAVHGRRLADGQDGVHDSRRRNAGERGTVLVRQIVLDHDLLRILPDLRRMRAQREPQTDEVGLSVSYRQRSGNSRGAK